MCRGSERGCRVSQLSTWSFFFCSVLDWLALSDLTLGATSTPHHITATTLLQDALTSTATQRAHTLSSSTFQVRGPNPSDVSSIAATL